MHLRPFFGEWLLNARIFRGKLESFIILGIYLDCLGFAYLLNQCESVFFSIQILFVVLFIILFRIHLNGNKTIIAIRFS